VVRAVVELQHIAKRYGDAAVLSDISLTLEPGGLYCLTGASGAGKTTLLRIICLAEPPSSGGLNLFGTGTAALDRRGRAALRRRIGLLFQDLRLLDELTARDNVALPLRIAGVPESDIRDNVAELLAWVGLADRSEARTATLSEGERRRVAIARAIIGRPELLLADEPAGSGEPEILELLDRGFEWLNRLGTTVVIATQDAGLAHRFAHRRFHLERGRLSEAADAPAQ
jgi:cell division transport system ATP-binding protein